MSGVRGPPSAFLWRTSATETWVFMFCLVVFMTTEVPVRPDPLFLIQTLLLNRSRNVFETFLTVYLGCFVFVTKVVVVLTFWTSTVRRPLD